MSLLKAKPLDFELTWSMLQGQVCSLPRFLRYFHVHICRGFVCACSAQRYGVDIPECARQE
jgi:hypothetical protein